MGGAEDMSNDHLEQPESHLPMTSKRWFKVLQFKMKKKLFRPSEYVKYYSEQWKLLLTKEYSPATMPGTRKPNLQDHMAVRLTLENNLSNSGIRVKNVFIEEIEHLKAANGNPLRVYHVRAEVW